MKMRRNGCNAMVVFLVRGRYAKTQFNTWLNQSRYLIETLITWTKNDSHSLKASATTISGWCSAWKVYLAGACNCALSVLGACYICCIALKLLDVLRPETFH